MKIVAVFLISLALGVFSAPTDISDNNIGDIITVGVKADLNLKNDISASLFNLLGARTNGQSIGINRNRGNQDFQPLMKRASMPSISPDFIKNISKMLSESQKS